MYGVASGNNNKLERRRERGSREQRVEGGL